MAKVNETNVVRSSLWAAYGDAIGFPTELVSAADFEKRNLLSYIEQPIAWRRRVGGMFGPEVDFAEGTYSDDTQLRLSTSRAINSEGFFDVESFAKIELPVWLNYALGAGRGSKAAAANLALKESSWSLNFFASNNTKYWEGGGNGAAMRIHPHVWHNHSGTHRSLLSAVIRNSICTHGHPRALVGAVIHAAMLYETMQNGTAIHPADWAGLGEAMGQAGIDILEADPELPLVWIPTWERFSKVGLRESWMKTIAEWVQASTVAADICAAEHVNPERAYTQVLKALNAFDSSERGSGLKTPLYASVLAWLYRDQAPEVALASAANIFGTDTDTIATMAGALIGVIAPDVPKTKIQDEKYIQSEASRMFYIGRNEKVRSFKYPDLLNWSAPKSQSDAWVSGPKGERLLGIGAIRPFGPIYKTKKGVELVWQWAELDFGQTVLVKRRASQIPFDKEAVSEDKEVLSAARKKPSKNGSLISAANMQGSLIDDESQPAVADMHASEVSLSDLPKNPLSLDALTQQCIREDFNPTVIGASLLSLMEGPEAIERAIAFTAIIAKAKIFRSK
jgi:ADP-ribosylglycohydrolase